MRNVLTIVAVVEGRSWAWQINVWTPSNYDRVGKKKLAWLLAVQLIMALSTVFGLGLLMGFW